MDQAGLLQDKKSIQNGKHKQGGDIETPLLGIFDKPLPCCGCGIGWFSFLLGFVFPLMWYFATILYFGNYYRRDPRERSGLAASAIAAMVFTVVLLVTLAAILLQRRQ